MNRLGLLAAVVTLVASPALAQDAPSDGAPAHPWSLGAGVSGGELSFGVLGSLSGTVALTAPRASMSAERKLTPKTSVLLGLTATAASTTSAPVNQPGGFTSSSAVSTQAFALGLGVRQVLMGDEAVVALSGHAVLSYGYNRTEQSSSFSNGTTTTTSDTVSNGGTLALSAGIAGERLLTDQLSLRLSLGLFQAGYSAGRNALSGFGTPQTFSGFTLGLQLTPALELRLYF